jgi:hypothetical protein
MAVDIFWQDNPLPRASMKTGHYEAITGGDSLALALLDCPRRASRSAAEDSLEHHRSMNAFLRCAVVFVAV